ncbi:flagellar filament capping protein FliD [Clostridium frigoris]|uniref:Flagellar hook-associated protein 2 n=1 Tax=Clostridium frigoris TaxID=205327 RepID=A0ABS6BT76_9CLOT|nr:flagellar filament capping protein FliD [Clostridium frigoris]MBU3159058.1 flagellar filament capping protein FliD [Clostridium frigoris]
MSSIYPSTSSTTSTTSSSNLLRISGMASGIDTDAVVKSMVSNYQTKIDKANQAKQTLAWQQDAYKGIITGIKGLQDYFDPLSSKYMMSGSSMNINTAASDGASVVTATSGSAATAGTYKVNVSKLAEQAKIVGKSQNSMIAVSASNWTANNLTFSVTTASVTTLGVTTPGVTTSVALAMPDLSSGTPQDIVTAINSKIAGSSLNGKITASYVKEVNKEGTNEYIKFTKASSNTDTIKLVDTDNAITDVKDCTINSGISSTSKLSDLGITTDTSFSLSYDTATNTKPVTISATSTSTIKDLMDKVNSATGGAVTMSIDDTTGKILFQSKEYGSASGFKITETKATTDLPNSIITKLGLSGSVLTTADGVTTNTITKLGTDALVSITAPGQSAVTTTQSSNKFTVNGVTYNLVGANSGTDTSNVTVTSNSDTVVTNIKSFIEDYNTIISTINKKLTETKDKNYSPLTDAQKTSMSETQITTWETKAKVGILKKDDYLSSLLTQLRGTLYSPVYSSYDSTDASTGKAALNFGAYGTDAVGIQTSTDTTDGGKLVISDEAKLKDAIENNMEDFKKLFIGSSSSTLTSTDAYIGSKKYKEDGIFTRMDSIIRDYVASPGLGKDGTYTLSGSMNIFVNKQYDYSTSGTAGKNTLPDQVYNKTLSVSKFQAQLDAASTRYYAKFTALEKAMNALNSQQSALSSMLGTSSS